MWAAVTFGLLGSEKRHPMMSRGRGSRHGAFLAVQGLSVISLECVTPATDLISAKLFTSHSSCLQGPDENSAVLVLR